MASTNKTTNYELSQYIGTDKPTYLSDYNGDMLKIDTAMKTNADNISTAVSSIESVTVVANQANTTANTASTNASNAVSTANSASTTAGNAQSTANSALSTATTAQSTANANSALIGDLTTLETTVKTDLVSAINEIIESEIESNVEHKTEKVWDNKPVYRKVITTSALGNNQTIQIDHGIANFDKLVDYSLVWYDTGDQRWYNTLRLENNSTFIEANGVSTSKVFIKCMGQDWSSRTSNVSITIEYTKTTD